MKSLSIVIPCYNEAKDIKSKINDFVIPFLTANKFNYELLLVNDGSKDNTLEVINSLSWVTALSYENNLGKGGAVKYGISHANKDYVLFMDADLSTDLKAINDVMPLLDEYDMIIGSRHVKGAVLAKKQPLSRRFIGWCCRLLVRMTFGFKYKDTQCGFKVMKKEVADKIIAKQTINNFAFDVEYLYIAKLNNIKVHELPVTWSDDRGSTVSPLKSSIKFFKDIFKIRRKKKNYYF